jgi:hypothetical protein
LLEYFDRDGETARLGEVRRLRNGPRAVAAVRTHNP